MADQSRINDLRLRVERDPASIAFAQLAEEYRRAGQLDEAVQTCRTGLATHPEYSSARVTLGRADLRDGSGVFQFADLGLSPTLRDLILQMIISFGPGPA